jgi:NitT/TauT family transport system permease protein
MYATIFSIVAFAVITVSLLHRLETTIFRPEKRGS